jgi:hypothetical protein
MTIAISILALVIAVTSAFISYNTRQGTLLIENLKIYGSDDFFKALAAIGSRGRENANHILEYQKLDPLNASAAIEIVNAFPLPEHIRREVRKVKYFYSNLYRLHNSENIYGPLAFGRILSNKTLYLLLEMAGFEVLIRYVKPIDNYVYFSVRHGDEIDPEHFYQDSFWYHYLEKYREKAANSRHERYLQCRSSDRIT